MSAGTRLIAQAIWNARNNADPADDAFAAHLMAQEAEVLLPLASGLVRRVHAEGLAFVSAVLDEATVDELLKSVTRFRNTEMAGAIYDRLRALYDLGSARRLELDSPELHALLTILLGREIAEGQPGDLDMWDRRRMQRGVLLICEDLSAAGYRLVPNAAPQDLIATMMDSRHGSSLSLVFGEDPQVIATLYRTMIDHQRAR